MTGWLEAGISDILCEFSNEIQEFECPGQDEFTHCVFSPIWSLDSKPILPGMMFQQ